MKKLFLTLVALVVATVSYAQNTLVATLSHGENITMYYGTYALRDAVNAAVSGDVINLSGGGFQAVDITKAVTLRGTGIDDTYPTYIIGSFIINMVKDNSYRLYIEGIRCTGSIRMQGTFNSPYFVKCSFHHFIYADDSAIQNAIFSNCKINGGYHLVGSCSVQFLNCYVYDFHNFSEKTANASFINCVMMPYDGYRTDMFTNTFLLNCIIHNAAPDRSHTDYLPSTTIATNCVAIGFRDLFKANAANTHNMTATFAEMFKSFTGTYSDSQTFELTDAAKKTYLGNDGTEVGLYGGVLPYDSTPSYPQITKMNVANKTTADGKLSVEIEVSAAE